MFQFSAKSNLECQILFNSKSVYFHSFCKMHTNWSKIGLLKIKALRKVEYSAYIKYIASKLFCENVMKVQKRMFWGQKHSCM